MPRLCALYVSAILACCSAPAWAADANPQIDYDGYTALALSLGEMRDRHRLDFAEFMEHARKGDAILLDASSTAYYLGLALKDRQRLRVVTNGLDVARLLASNPTNTVILIGGILNQDGSSVTGLFSEQVIEELHVQKAFVSCTGFSLASGLTEEHMEEALLKKKAIESAKEVIALVDSSMIGKEDLTPFARLEQICCLYTDEGLTSECQDMVEKAGISLTVCRNI